MKKDPLDLTPKTDENKSPTCMSGNKMMMSWLSKGGSKPSVSANKSPIKNIDSNSQKQEEKPLNSKTISSKLKKLNDEDGDEDDDRNEKTVSKKLEKFSYKKTETSKIENKLQTKAETISKTDNKAQEKPESKAKKSKETTPPKKSSKSSKKEELEESPGLDEKKPTSAKKPANKFYAAYMRREGPKNPGSKPVPIGKPNCFAGLKFLTTGVLDSLDRDECKKIIEKYGGSLISGVTKKLDYLIVGEDAGQSKLEKANELNIKQINEDQFLELICQKSGISNPKYESSNIELDESFDLNKSQNESLEKETKESKKKKSSDNFEELKSKKIKSEPEESPQKSKSSMVNLPVKTVKASPTDSEIKKKPNLKNEETESNVQTQLWVEKYKPTSFTKIIGQNTEKSNANKLLNWLKNWQKFHQVTGESKTKKPWNDQETGSSFKAALLSGPPGIGKTTTAQLTCKEAGYTYIEFNASDSRSKKLLDKVIGESSDSCSIDSYLKGKHKVNDLSKDKHCIIMDEVDGMAGNEDRGGIQELILKIKNSKIPIICICNDRQHTKIRTLSTYCFDLRFYKPRLEQVRAGLMSVCFKEKIKISSELIDQIIVGCNYDIRQCLHNLSMWSSNNKELSSNQSIKNDIEKAIKDTKMNPFEACKQVFYSDQTTGAKPKNMIERMDLFFTDYALMPLLVQENYLTIKPFNLKGNTKQQKDKHHLQLLDEAADSICISDKIGRQIRTYNNWSLLSSQAVFATVIPGNKLSGSIGLPAFPGWFGKNSKQGRVDRILQELQKHMRLHISANKIGVGMEYLSVLKKMLSDPLIKRGADGINDVIKIMNDYCLTRDDFDTILELGTWPGQKDPMTLIDSKVKAAFTRTYNKESHKNPFTIVNIKKLKASKLSEEGAEIEDEEEEEENEDADEIESDAMIKKVQPKKTASKTSATKRAANTKDVDSTLKPTASKKKKT